MAEADVEELGGAAEGAEHVAGGFGGGGGAVRFEVVAGFELGGEGEEV